ncbi:MAG: hypothetical protein PHH87_00515 [Desulfuromonas sp.]|nr:hypothetical protein [Desulfuromonas sp.]
MAIKANAGQKRVLVMSNMPLDVSVELSPGIYSGLPAEWWLLAETEFGVFHYSLNGTWVPGHTFTHQGPLFELPDFKVLSTIGLPPGEYKLKFGLDPIIDGILNSGALIEEVNVTIVPFNCTERPTDSLAALSSVQQAFIANRGNPDFFVVGFSSEHLDRNGKVAYSNKVRRIESWVYSGAMLVTAIFDNGHFVEETSQAGVSRLEPTYLSPSQFTHCMNRNDVVALMGEPSCVMTEVMGGQTYQYLRYDPKPRRAAATVVLENGLLISVTAGFSLAYPALANQCF